MSSDVRLAVAGPHVISETIDGETVVINLDTGVYFSLGGTASEVWEMVLGSTTGAQVSGRLAGRYEVDLEELRHSLDGFLLALETEGLVRRDMVAAAPVVAEGPGGGERLPFVPPSLQSFTDIKDLLLLDPIHEVDDRGWPNPRVDG